MALPGLRPGELKIKMSSAAIFVWRFKGSQIHLKMVSGKCKY